MKESGRGTAGADWRTMENSDGSQSAPKADLYRQPFTALGATGVEDFTAPTGRHPGAKTMVALALEVARLERSLHQNSLHAACERARVG